MPHILVIYNDRMRSSVIFVGKFQTLKQIVDFTEGMFKYQDKRTGERKYITYKRQFQLIENI